MKLWGVAIPGLAMRASEIPSQPGLLALENPEIGSGSTLPWDYSLEDVAEHHANTISGLPWEELNTPTIIGMSMGGMIASILATSLRSKLPTRCRFRFLVTSANSVDLPAVPDQLLDFWKTAKPGSEADFRNILDSFFSPKFAELSPSEVLKYARYRANGENLQTSRAFMRQLSALRRYNGEQYFSQLPAEESEIFGGEDDRILGPRHDEILKRLTPCTRHRSLKNVGHMINIELPGAFHRAFQPSSSE
jgi:pimeloyl-ACP methyl ester carboxylesterase